MRLRSPKLLLVVCLAAAACLISLVGPATSGATSCKHGFVKNQGKCVKKPPAGVPAPGLYKFLVVYGPVNAARKQKIAMKVKYLSGKFFVSFVAKIPASAYECNTNEKPKPDVLKGASTKIDAKKFFVNKGTSTRGRFSGEFMGEFISASKLNFQFADNYLLSTGGSCSAGTPGATRTVTLTRAASSDF
jgi:hypothetical protein